MTKTMYIDQIELQNTDLV